MKQGTRIQFIADHCFPISNWELTIKAGTTGTIHVIECDGVWVKLDKHNADLDEWENCVIFDPEVIDGDLDEHIAKVISDCVVDADRSSS